MVMSITNEAAQPSRNISSTQRQRGQGMTEYIIVVALIAVSAIGVYQLFGQTIRSQTSAIALEVSGQSGKTATTDATTAASSTNGERVAKGLASFAGTTATAAPGK